MNSIFRRLAAAGAMVVAVASVQAQPTLWPRGITARQVVYNAETNADSSGMKPGWVASSARPPKKGWWHTIEHGIGKTGPDRYILFSQETNRAYSQFPGATFEEAINFVELNPGFPAVAGTPVREAGYWRGNSATAQKYTWAPMMYSEGGTFYLFYTAPWQVAPGDERRSCFLATSTSGDANTAAWVQYDPNPGTPAIEPLFIGPADGGFRDFHVIKVQTSQGPKYYMYYIAMYTDSGLGVPVSDVRLRISDSVTSWPDAGELPTPVFRKVNLGITRLDRLQVDYENPSVVQHDDGSFYLFIGRHGIFPADTGTNPNWRPIPIGCEVYWSADGKDFSVQGPDLHDVTGRITDSPEIFREGSRWYATHAGLVNRLETYPFDCCFPDYDHHSPEFAKMVDSFEDAEANVQVFEFDFLPPTAADQQWALLE